MSYSIDDAQELFEVMLLPCTTSLVVGVYFRYGVEDSTSHQFGVTLQSRMLRGDPEDSDAFSDLLLMNVISHVRSIQKKENVKCRYRTTTTRPQQQ